MPRSETLDNIKTRLAAVADKQLTVIDQAVQASAHIAPGDIGQTFAYGYWGGQTSPPTAGPSSPFPNAMSISGDSAALECPSVCRPR
jgi:hypothetical protein